MADATEHPWTQEQVEGLARDFMGWERGDGVGMSLPPHYEGLENFWHRRTGAGPVIVADPHWNPFVEVSDDYRILHRARQVWTPDAVQWRSFAVAYIFLHGWNANTPEPAGITAMRLLNAYTVGDYARAVLAVLDSKEKP